MVLGLMKLRFTSHLALQLDDICIHPLKSTTVNFQQPRLPSNRCANTKHMSTAVVSHTPKLRWIEIFYCPMLTKRQYLPYSCTLVRGLNCCRCCFPTHHHRPHSSWTRTISGHGVGGRSSWDVCQPAVQNAEVPCDYVLISEYHTDRDQLRSLLGAEEGHITS